MISFRIVGILFVFDVSVHAVMHKFEILLFTSLLVHLLFRFSEGYFSAPHSFSGVVDSDKTLNRAVKAVFSQLVHCLNLSRSAFQASFFSRAPYKSGMFSS